MSEQWTVRPPSAASSVRQRFDIYAGETFVARCYGCDEAEQIVSEHNAALRLAATQAEVGRLAAVVDRFRGAIRDIHDESAAGGWSHSGSRWIRRWILNLSDEVFSELRHLSVATDKTIVSEGALAPVPREPVAGAEEVP